MYDADAYLAALEPPILRLGGHEHRGRILSFDEGLALQQKLATFSQGEASPERTRQVVMEACGILGLPADELLKLPIGGVLEALTHFLEAAVAMRRQPSPAPSTPNQA